VAVEFGLAGVVCLALLVFVIAKWTFIAWFRRGHDAHWSRAASVGVWIVLVHSLVDYPARTLTILVLTAVCMAILRVDLERRKIPQADGDGLSTSI
jgi:hypothetical protein